MSNLTSAIEQIKKGEMIILVDDEDRENEGDLVFAAEFVTAEKINFMAKYARGLICLSLHHTQVEKLGIPLMTPMNTTTRQTAFTVSIDAKEGITTGISAADRAETIRVAVHPKSTSNDIVSPGHMFPLRAVPGGVQERQGHTEASIALCEMSGLQSAAVICEIMNDDGTMARMPDLQVFAEKYCVPLLSIEEILVFLGKR